MQLDSHTVVNLNMTKEVKHCMQFSSRHSLRQVTSDTTADTAELPTVRAERNPTPTYTPKTAIASMLTATTVTSYDDALSVTERKVDGAILGRQSLTNWLSGGFLQHQPQWPCAGQRQDASTPEGFAAGRWYSFAPPLPAGLLTQGRPQGSCFKVPGFGPQLFSNSGEDDGALPSLV
jgi:hypothetical protein